jgi:nucleotide-binding universal stress UspA family protein
MATAGLPQPVGALSRMPGPVSLPSVPRALIDSHPERIGRRGGVVDTDTQTSLHDAGRAVLERLDVDVDVEGVRRRILLARATELARRHDARLIVIAAYEPEVYAGPAMVAASDLDTVLRGDLVARARHSVLVGGVSRRLVDNAPCPVLVVPRVPDGTADRTTELARAVQTHHA